MARPDRRSPRQRSRRAPGTERREPEWITEIDAAETRTSSTLYADPKLEVEWDDHAAAVSATALWAMNDGTFCVAVGETARGVITRSRWGDSNPPAPFTVAGHMATIDAERRGDGRPARQLLVHCIEP